MVRQEGRNKLGGRKIVGGGGERAGDSTTFPAHSRVEAGEILASHLLSHGGR